MFLSIVGWGADNTPMYYDNSQGYQGNAGFQNHSSGSADFQNVQAENYSSFGGGGDQFNRNFGNQPHQEVVSRKRKRSPSMSLPASTKMTSLILFFSEFLCILVGMI